MLRLREWHFQMKKIYKLRLLKLATHLLTGKLWHDEFDFSTWHREAAPGFEPCTSAGCALGECPHVFPRLWMLTADLPHLRRQYYDWRPLESASKFFGITYEDARNLFFTHPLSTRATRYDIGTGILNFLAYKKAEEERRGR
jgi:hypothetical protein